MALKTAFFVCFLTCFSIIYIVLSIYMFSNFTKNGYVDTIAHRKCNAKKYVANAFENDIIKANEKSN